MKLFKIKKQNKNIFCGNIIASFHVARKYSLVQRVLLHLGDEVPAHGEEEEAVVEGERGGGPARDGDADAHHVAEVEVLRHERVD